MRPEASAELGLDEAKIAAVVDLFYARVRADAELGPIFNEAVEDWDEHLQRLAGFWSSVMLRSGRYKGDPVGVHMKQGSAITAELFDRWLRLWGEVTAEVLPEGDARVMQARAAAIAESLKLALFFRLPSAAVRPQ